MKALVITSAVALWGMAISAWLRAPWAFWIAMLCLFAALAALVGMEAFRNENDGRPDGR